MTNKQFTTSIAIAAGLAIVFALYKKAQADNAPSVSRQQYFGGYGDSAIPDWEDGSAWASRLNITGDKVYI